MHYLVLLNTRELCYEPFQAPVCLCQLFRGHLTCGIFLQATSFKLGLFIVGLHWASLTVWKSSNISVNKTDKVKMFKANILIAFLGSNDVNEKQWA